MSTNLLNSGNSVSGQHRNRRVASVGSSPTIPTIKKLTTKQKTKLWNQLRKLDRDITEMDRFIKLNSYFTLNPKHLTANKNKRISLDLKRKEVRNKLKGY